MKRRYWAALGFTGILGLLFAAAPNPRYLEELAIGGGFGDAADGGAIFERDGDILTDGKITAGATSVDAASLSLPHGTAPTTPVNGDLWTTTTGTYIVIAAIGFELLGFFLTRKVTEVEV